jgi:hypothetical protein
VLDITNLAAPISYVTGTGQYPIPLFQLQSQRLSHIAGTIASRHTANKLRLSSFGRLNVILRVAIMPYYHTASGRLCFVVCRERAGSVTFTNCMFKAGLHPGMRDLPR